MDKKHRETRKDLTHQAYIAGSQSIQLHMCQTVTVFGSQEEAADAPQNVGTMFIVGALCPLAMAFARRDPDKFNEEHHERIGVEAAQNQAWSLVTPETLVWTALVAANMIEHADSDTISTGWGPKAFIPVLQQWQKLFPDRKPEDVLDPYLIRAIRECEAEADHPLNEFLSKRSGSLPPSTSTIN